ncbi:hypothetical protein NYE47_00780 [Paenibacillus sp. FSL H7-0941]|uniref:hypothetical protein n=1 Tax=Paenibacillus sp. FSL H7-0941 TaxID=2975351 RepID=UPI0030F514DD
MSDSGKVSLPTPERIEELKGRYEGLSPEDITFMTVGDLNSLLAALEESQQQKVTLKEELEDKINESNEFYKWWQEEVAQRNIYKHELAEAQQTIARQSAALGWYELGKPELARAAISNKEGSDKT